MTAPLAVPQHSERSGGPQLASMRANAVRAELLAEARTHASALALFTAMLTSSPEDSTDLGRAMNALRMYGAREALEEIDGALARVDAGTYGICLACDQSIPVEHLATVPQARFCATCPTQMAPAADGSPEPCLGSSSGERTGPPPPGALAATPRPTPHRPTKNVLAEGPLREPSQAPVEAS